MNQRDLLNLFKFMNLTKSQNDGEALAALRRINGILDAAGKTWEDIYNLCKSAPDPQAPAEAQDKTAGWEEEIVNLPSQALQSKMDERFAQIGYTKFEQDMMRKYAVSKGQI